LIFWHLPTFTLFKPFIMKQFLFATLFTVLFCAFTVTNPTLPIGSALPQPDKKMMDISGNMISMKEAAKNNGLLVIFSCNTCPYVIKNETRINSMVDLAQKLNIGTIIINSNEAKRDNEDSFEAMKEYAKEKRLTSFYTVDENSQMADAFGANRTPECFLFGKNMTLVYHGAIDDNANDEKAVKRTHLKEAMMEVSAGKPVSVPETKSIGCTIKRKP